MAVGEPFGANVITAANRIDPQYRSFLKFNRMATVPEVSRFSSMMPWQVKPFVEVVRSALGARNFRTFVDISAHIGGEAIVLAKALELSGTAVEIDETAFQCLKHNIEQMGEAHQIVPLLGDGAAYVLDGRARADIVYADPPWGGPSYKSGDPVRLQLGGHPAHELVAAALAAGARAFILKCPTNVDMSSFDAVDADFECRAVNVPTHTGLRPSFLLCFFYRRGG